MHPQIREEFLRGPHELWQDARCLLKCEIIVVRWLLGACNLEHTTTYLFALISLVHLRI
jgi:hypothetical protein